jgi:polyisoprenoid-binding protein YceI
MSVTAANMNYAVVAFAVIIFISAVQWFVDGRHNFTGPSFDEVAFTSVEGRIDEETSQLETSPSKQ